MAGRYTNRAYSGISYNVAGVTKIPKLHFMTRSSPQVSTLVTWLTHIILSIFLLINLFFVA